MQQNIRRCWWLFVLPTLSAFVLAFLLPFVLGVGLSFTRFTTVLDARWVGVSNYVTAFTRNRDFGNALWFTVRFAAVTVAAVNALGLMLALALMQPMRGRDLLRTVFFLPNLIGGIVLGWIGQLVLNGLLTPFGKTLSSDAPYGFWGLVALMVWQTSGYMMIVYVAGLTAIPGELYDAAAVDGAGRAGAFWHVTLPQLAPSVTICVFLTLSNSFKLFDQNLALTAGAPARSTTMLALDIYNTFYGRVGWQGVGQAKAVVFFVLVAGLSLGQLMLTRRGEAALR